MSSIPEDDSCDIVRSIKKHPKNKKLAEEIPALDWNHFQGFFRRGNNRKNQTATNITATFNELKANEVPYFQYPYYFICKIFANKKFLGNGTLIGNHTVLTCAHLFIKENLNSFAQNLNSFAIIIFDYSFSIKTLHSDYPNLFEKIDVSTDKDWAILEIESDIIKELTKKQAGIKIKDKPFQMRVHNNETQIKDISLSAWYESKMTKLNCNIEDVPQKNESNIAHHNANTQKGYSGAPIYEIVNEIPSLIAVHLKEGKFDHSIIQKKAHEQKEEQKKEEKIVEKKKKEK